MSSQFDYVLEGFNSTKQQLSKFVKDREWEQYHTPKNVLLALCGECGELCEIFQWKGKVDNLSSFTEQEIIHIGEEISDVFVYNLRLSDLCGIDIVSHICNELQINDVTLLSIIESKELLYNTLITKLNHSNSNTSLFHKSIRDIVLYVNSQIGIMSNIFSEYSDDHCTIGLLQWNTEHINVISKTMAIISISLIYLSEKCLINFQYNLERKFTQNNKKYPVEKAKGSAAKYTAYENKSAAPSNEITKSESGSVWSFFIHAKSLLSSHCRLWLTAGSIGILLVTIPYLIDYSIEKIARVEVVHNFKRNIWI